MSKQPSKFVDGSFPIYLEGGKGCRVWDAEANTFIDYPCSLGANLLGYAYPEVNEAVKNRIDRGILFTLPSQLETRLAEKINELIPCSEQVRFLKTGSEATSAAIKLARAYSGKNGIAYCGYHGWHDWFTCDTPKNKGIPVTFKAYIDKFEYNNIESLEVLLKTGCIGVVILEPYVYDEPRNKTLTQDNFLQKVIKLSHKYKAVVIFDEVVTGFRTQGYSAQKMFRAIPDLCTIGKAMGNGFPISAVCGKKKIMRELEGDCFVSSTFGGDLIGISAALATINVLETEEVIPYIYKAGGYLKNSYNTIAKDLHIDTKCIGFPNRTMFMFPSNAHKGLFWQECLLMGVLFGYAQFINYSHHMKNISYTIAVIEEALKTVKRYWENPKRALKGICPKEVFCLLCKQTEKT